MGRDYGVGDVLLTIEDDFRYVRWDYEAFNSFIRRLYRGEVDADPPLLLRQLMGKPQDITWSDYSPVLLVSRRVVELLQEQSLTGWGTYNVLVMNKDGAHLPGYFGLSITGRAGTVDIRRGVVVDKSPKVPGGKPYQVLRGFYFENNEWDRSDFCVPGVAGSPIVTHSVVEAFERANVIGVEFTPVREYEADLSIYKIAGTWPPRA
jgi:hypothetical protein